VGLGRERRKGGNGKLVKQVQAIALSEPYPYWN